MVITKKHIENFWYKSTYQKHKQTTHNKEDGQMNENK